MFGTRLQKNKIHVVLSIIVVDDAFVPIRVFSQCSIHSISYFCYPIRWKRDLRQVTNIPMLEFITLDYRAKDVLISRVIVMVMIVKKNKK